MPEDSHSFSMGSGQADRAAPVAGAEAPARAASLAAKGRAALEAGDEPGAIACLEQALAIDPESEAAGEPLAAVLLRRGEHAKAEPILGMLLRRFRGSRTAEQLRPLHIQLAGTAAQLGKTSDALRWYRVAHQTDPGDKHVLRHLADLHYDRREWDDALGYYQMIQVQFEGKLAAGERVEVYHRVGFIKLEAGDKLKARNMWDKALRLDPHHRPTLEALVAMHAADGEFDRVLDLKATMARAAAGDGERFALLREAAEIRRDRMGDHAGAIAAFEEALAVRPDDHGALVALLELLRGAAQWRKAIDVCRRIAALETDPRRACACHRLAASIWLDTLGDPHGAVEAHERALDADPSDLSGLTAIERILSPRGEWEALEGVYLRMLDRLPAEGSERARDNLSTSLGELARDRLGEFERAVGYFRRAAGINPAGGARHEILADLFCRMPGRWADAAAEHHALVRADPKRLESYRALRRIYHEAGRADETWCVCAALVFLERAEPNEAEFHRRYRPKAAPGIRGTLDPDAWRSFLYHPDEDRAVAAILDAIEPAIRKGVSRSRRSLGLRKPDLQEPETSGLAIARALRQAAAALGVAAPDLYAIPGHAGGLTFAPTDSPALVAGREVLSGFSPAELRFAAAKYLSAARREHQVQYLLAPVAADLKAPVLGVLLAHVLAAIRLVEPGAAGPAGEAAAAATKLLNSRLSSSARESLRAAVRNLADGAVAGIERWMAGAELTGDRAGLLLCGDLATAAAAIPRLPALHVELPHQRRVDDMIAFSVSEAHFALRRRLGIALAGAPSDPGVPANGASS